MVGMTLELDVVNHEKVFGEQVNGTVERASEGCAGFAGGLRYFFNVFT